jgi:uncharacterized protein (TIGR02996 family)
MTLPSDSADEDALVREIIADPWDALARSVYADWLDENGKPHHAGLVRDPGAGLPEQIRADVEGVFPRGVQAAHVAGMVSVRVDLRLFLTKKFQSAAPAWLRANHITRIRPGGNTKDWAKLGDAPALAHLHALDLECQNLRDEGAQALAGCSGLAGLSSLSVAEAGLRGDGVKALASSPLMPRLVHLDLRAAHLGMGPEELRALGDGPLAGRLRHLDLSQISMTVGGRLAVLLSCSALIGGLATLHLRYCNLDDRCFGRLLESPHLAGLRSLDLGYNTPTDTGLLRLAASPLMRSLRRLALPMDHHPAEGVLAVVRAAADSPGLTLALGRDVSGETLRRYRGILGPRLVLE